MDLNIFAPNPDVFPPEFSFEFHPEASAGVSIIFVIVSRRTLTEKTVSIFSLTRILHFISSTQMESPLWKIRIESRRIRLSERMEQRRTVSVLMLVCATGTYTTGFRELQALMAKITARKIILYAFIFFPGIKRRTGFCHSFYVTVADYSCIRVSRAEGAQQSKQTLFLSRGAGILRTLTICIEPSYIAEGHSAVVHILPGLMLTTMGIGAQTLEPAVEVYEQMISGISSISRWSDIGLKFCCLVP